MADNSDSTDPFFATAKELLNAVDDGTGDEFVETVEEQFGDVNVTDAVLGGVAAGEQINAMRRQSRGISGTDTAPEAESGPDVIVRDIEGNDGGYAGSRIFISDPHAQYFCGDESLLIRGDDGDTEVPMPRGIGSVDEQLNDGVKELLVRPDGYESPDDAPTREGEAPTSDDNPQGSDGETPAVDADSGEESEDTADGDE